MSQPVEESNFYDEGYDDDERVLDNRVKFADKMLYGRERELKSLHDIYGKVRAKQSTEVVLISGYSGTGKSALVRRLAEEILTKTMHGTATTNKGSVSDNSNDKCERMHSNEKPCFFLTGKFDDLQSADPFSAIGQAFSEFTNVLRSQEDDAILHRVGNSARKAVGSEGKVLTDLFPSLNCILEEMTTEGHKEEGGDGDASGSTKPLNTLLDASYADAFGGLAKQKMWNKLSYVFLQFVKAICLQGHAVVLFLDDLQWADTPSLDLITSLIQDSSLRNFLFIGAFRSNEVHEDHPVSQNFSNVAKQTKTIHRFELTNLSLEDINMFISDTLGMDVGETLPLTRALYNKTRGNIFFTMQALEEWNRRNIIYYSNITFEWEWNLKQVVQEGLQLSDDVVGVVAMKIKTLPGILQEALSVASYTRSTFDVETLLSLLDAVGKYKHEKGELVRLLDTAILENLLINIVGSTDYKFAHDRIQQAAYYLIPTLDGRTELRKRIGMHLLKRGSSDVGEDWMLFIAADHLNSSLKSLGKENIDNANSTGIGSLDSLTLAKLNLFVGEKAMQSAAFTPASRYLRMAQTIVLATTSPWNTHYEFTLRIHSAAMDAELALGNNETGYNIGQQILDNARTIENKLPTYHALSLSLARQERNREALDYCLTALPVLCKFPNRFYSLEAMRKMRKVRMLLKENSNEDILQLPKMTDKRQLMASEFLYECCFQAYLCNNLFLSLVCLVLNIQLSFKHGLCSFHGFAFVGYGVLVSGHFGKHEIGLRMSRLGKEIINICEGGKQIQSRVIYVACADCDAWTLPGCDINETLRRGHLSGMQCGDLEFAFRNRAFMIHYSYLEGNHLLSVEKACCEALEEALRYRVHCVIGILHEMRFLFRHLIGGVPYKWKRNSSGPMIMSNDYNGMASCGRMDDDDICADGLDWKKIETYGMDQHDNKGEGYKLLHGLLSRLELAVYFDKLEVAEKVADAASKFFQVCSQYALLTTRLCFWSLAASGLLRKTKKKKYKVWARQMLKQMKKTPGEKNHHLYLLMHAELKAALSTFDNTNHNIKEKRCDTCVTKARFSNKVTTAVERTLRMDDNILKLYDEAISAALKIGCRQHAALGNELAGKHLLNVGEDESLAAKYLKQAQTLYKNWGALKKVEHLQNRHRSLLM